MFKAYKFLIEPQRITLYPFYAMRRAGVVLAILFVLMGVIPTGFLLLKGGELRLIVPVLICLCVGLLGGVPFYVWGLRKLVFDNESQTIYYQGLFKKNLMPFAEARLQDFVLKNKNDMFAEGTNLVPPLKSGTPMFEEVTRTLLPAIKKMIGTAAAMADTENVSHMLQTGHFEFYKQSDDGNTFQIKAGLRWKELLILIGGLFGWGAWGYACFMHAPKEQSDFLYLVLPLIPLLFLLALLTEKTFFNREEKTLMVKYLGILFVKEDLSDFNNLVVTRHTLNGIYTGTNVKAQFILAGKRQFGVGLYSFYKTKDIQVLTQETHFIIKLILTGKNA